MTRNRNLERLVCEQVVQTLAAVRSPGTEVIDVGRLLLAGESEYDR